MARRMAANVRRRVSIAHARPASVSKAWRVASGGGAWATYASIAGIYAEMIKSKLVSQACCHKSCDSHEGIKSSARQREIGKEANNKAE